MLLSSPLYEVSELRSAIRVNYRSDEEEVLERLLPLAELDDGAQDRVNQRALQLAKTIRKRAKNNTGIQDMLNEYALSTQEGIVLMCLAEALLRVPDATTADRLIRDKLISGDWSSHLGNQDSFFVNASAWGLLLSGRVVSFNEEQRRRELGRLKKTVGRMGEPVIRAAMRQAMRIMGTQFVLGRDIEEANRRASKEEEKGYSYSYDMLGEAARTMEDADAYFQSYRNAIERIGHFSAGKDHIQGAGISVKLSAIHPRYEFAQRERVMTELLPRLKSLALLAKGFNIGFTVDAEEADRLDISLDIIEALFTDPELDGWEGFGIAVQAYQKRGIDVIEWVIDLCRRVGRKMMVRLVKGAYWDTEIKFSQVEGLEGYPVFTRKAATDVSYQSCARRMLDNRELLYPQFATHNAYSVAAILELAGDLKGFEFQRLHGMGDGLYDSLLQELNVPCRIYAPVGEHEDLLAYLVRRLLENGANTSFVNNIVDDSVSLESLIEDPVAKVKGWVQKFNVNIPLPKDIYGAGRVNSQGVDLTDVNQLSRMQANIQDWCEANVKPLNEPADSGFVYATNPSDCREILGQIPITSPERFDSMLARASDVFDQWSAIPVAQRAACLERLGDALECHRDEFIALCTKEAGKVAKDGVAEVREAVDFCRYYAIQASRMQAENTAWGDNANLQARGVVLCISPWNFPLAIFLGQITAALAAGNAVIAKPAESTALIAHRTVQLMRECGFPEGVVQLINCPGRLVGEALLPDERVAAVMFTGSTAVGANIAKVLAQRAGDRVPLIAETGGQNCMIVDSTALPEQVVDDVIASGFQSAGQRCSALRVLFLQEEVADKIIGMIVGAMQQLRISDPAWLHTDVGPVIDQKALSALNNHVEFMLDRGELLYQCPLTEECEQGYFFAPRLYEISDIDVLKEEVFGPVVHVVRYKASNLDKVFEAINSTGFGLTAGIHTRIQTTAQVAAAEIKAGNIYVNRNTIGAVVGVQPFGGQGLSGTGPKAGGPSYLYRLVKEVETRIEPQPAINLASRETLDPQLQSQMDLCLQEMKQSAEVWRNVPVVKRAEMLKQITHLIQVGQGASEEQLTLQCQLLAEEALSSQEEPTTLPGPTGELNQLFDEPRGVLVCISCDENSAASYRQVLAALITGNTVIHVTLGEAPLTGPNLRRQLQKARLDAAYRQLQINDEQALTRLLMSESIAGVVVNDRGELARKVDGILSDRKGALLPLITESVGPTMLRRFVIEKVISTDTTASGGNATLLAMGEE